MFLGFSLLLKIIPTPVYLPALGYEARSGIGPAITLFKNSFPNDLLGGNVHGV
jgi:hypothetical protein